MNRIKQSVEFIRTSLAILRKHKKLAFLYLLSLLPLSVFILIVIIKVWSGSTAGGFLEMMSLLYLMFFAWFLVIFFNVAFTHGVLTLLEGGRSFSIRESLKEALMRLGLIFKWIGFTAVLLLLLSGLKHWIPATAAGVVSNILSWAWLCATYFIAPIMVFENLTAIQALERSIRLLRKTWVELIIFGAIIGAGSILTILMLVVSVVGVSLLLAHMTMPVFLSIMLRSAVFGFLLCILCIMLVILLGIMPLTYATVLYSYAITGMSPREFQTKPEDKSND